MKNNSFLKLKLIILTIVLPILSCKAQQIQEPNLNIKIIGTWIHNEDPKVKLIFNNSGKLFDYYDNGTPDVFDYLITTQCNGRTTTANYDIFLKITEDNGIDSYCHLLSGIHTDSSGVTTLSITSEGGKLWLYTKQ